MRRPHPLAATLSAMIIGTPAMASDPRPDYEVIRYHLPEASVVAKLALTLESCSPAGVTASGDLTLAAEAGASAASYALTSRQLESARIKRSLDITLHDTGAIATVDSSVEDRTGAIFGNIIKFVASVAGAFLGAKSPAATPAASTGSASHPVCNDGVMNALRRVREIDNALAGWRTGPVPQSPKDASEESQAIDRLAAERAALRIGVLHVDLQAPLAMNQVSAGQGGGRAWTIAATMDAMALTDAWLKSGSTPPRITATWTISLPSGTSVPAATRSLDAFCSEQLAATAGGGLCLAAPATATFSLAVTAAGMSLAGGPLSAQGKFPIPQWGGIRILPLSAGFGSNRETSLTLDKFGRVTAAKWTSAARAENVTSALAGLADQANGIVAANSQTAREKSEIDQLQTQQTLNRLRACREILNAGGSACPAEATATQ